MPAYNREQLSKSANKQDDENVCLGANIFFTGLKEQKGNYKMTERARKGILM